jgi:hypothetical protein
VINYCSSGEANGPPVTSSGCGCIPITVGVSTVGVILQGGKNYGIGSGTNGLQIRVITDNKLVGRSAKLHYSACLYRQGVAAVYNKFVGNDVREIRVIKERGIACKRALNSYAVKAIAGAAIT